MTPEADVPAPLPPDADPARESVDILLVDDHPENLLALELSLRDLGQNLHKASSGAEALRHLLEHPVALILLDVQMPGMSGFELAAMVRERERTRHTPIIFITGHHLQESNVFKGYALGAVDYIVKPYAPEILRSKVSVFVELHRRGEQVRRHSEALRENNARLLADVERRRRAEEDLSESERRYRSVVECAQDMISTVSPEGVILSLNPAFERIIGRPQAEWVGRKFDELVHPDDLPRVYKLIRRALEGEAVPPFEARVRTAAGGEVALESTIVPLTRNGAVTGVLGVSRDVTLRRAEAEAVQRLNEDLERRVAERTFQLRASLHEKEVLLKEIHHRVKNNLQIISSLLNMQAGRSRSAEVAAVLQDCRGRIKTMALIHEMVYRSGDLARIDFSEYVRSLVENIVDAFGAAPGRVRVETDVAHMNLDMDRAVPCSMIVYELVMNSLKHAFPGERRGNIEVTLGSVEPGRLRLEVRDDGAGLPPGLDFRKTESLGLQLVCRLTEHLDGSIRLGRSPGAAFQIEFPAAKSPRNKEAVP